MDEVVRDIRKHYSRPLMTAYDLMRVNPVAQGIPARETRRETWE